MILNENELTLPNDLTGQRLKEATCLVLENWPVFKLGLEYGTHNIENLTPTQIIDQFGTLLAAFIINMDVEKEDIQQFIESFLDKKFQIIVEDGSSQFIASKLQLLFFDLEKGSLNKYNELKYEIQKFEEKGKIQHKIDIQNSDEEEEEEAPQLKNNQGQQQQFEEENNNEDDWEYQEGVEEEENQNNNNEDDDDGFQVVEVKQKKGK